MEILDATAIERLLQHCYSESASVEPSTVCLLNALFAIGSLAVETSQGSEYVDSTPCRSVTKADEYFDFAQTTLMRFKGDEPFKLWMIQAWALLTTYSLASSRWHAADIYIG